MLIAKTEGKLFYANFGMDGLCIYLFSMKTKLFILTIFFLVYFKLFKKEKEKKKESKMLLSHCICCQYNIFCFTQVCFTFFNPFSTSRISISAK